MKQLLTLLLFFSTTVVIAQTTTSTSSFLNLGWESGTRTQGVLSTASWCEPSHDALISKDYARTGSSSLRFQIDDTDPNCTGHMRTEGASRTLSVMSYNNTIAWSELIPTTMAYDILHEVHFQMHDSGALGSPLWGIDVYKDRYYFGITIYDKVLNTVTQKRWDLGPVTKGVWVNWIVVQKLRMDPSGNYKVYKNGVLATGQPVDQVYNTPLKNSDGSITSPVTMNINGTNLSRLENGKRDGKPYPKFGIYKWEWTPYAGYPTGKPHTVRSKVVYMDDVKIGDSTAPLSQFLYTTALASTTTKTTVSCNGGNDGTATINVSGGTAPYTYTWNTSPVQYVKTATGLAAGSYTVTAKDAAGNSTSATVSIAQPEALVLTATAAPILLNGGSTSVDLTATGGTAPYTYTGPASVVAGTYTYSVKDAKGCAAVRTITVTQPAALTASVTASPVKCFGGTSTVTVTANGGVAPYTGTGIFSATAGSYSYVVKDKYGAISTATITITQPSLLDITVNTSTLTQPTCAAPSGSVELNNLPASGTWTLTRKPDSLKITGTGSSALITGLMPGKTYSYNVTNEDGCISSTCADIVINTLAAAPTVPVAGTIIQPTCAVPTATVVLNGLPASGTWTLKRTPGDIITTGSGTTQTITDLTAGTTYAYTVTNDAGCTSLPNENIVINSAPSAATAPVVASVTQPTCAVPSGSVVLTDLPTSGTWTLTRMPGNFVSSVTGTSKTITGLVAGTTYNYTLNSSDGCASAPSAGIVIAASPKPAIKATSINTINTLNSCGASVTAGYNLVLAGYPAPTVTYKIGTTPISTPYLFPAGTTIVTATATNSCASVSTTFTLTVTDNQAPVITCVPNATKTISGNSYTVSGKEFDATASDNCGVSSLIYSLSGATVKASGSNNKTLNAVRFNKGITTVTWVATDLNGKISSCTSTVTVTNSSATALKKASISAANLDTPVSLTARVMPNPFTSQFTLTLKGNNDIIKIIVTDAAGRIIEQKNVLSNTGTLQLGAAYPAGIYFATILQGKEKLTLKLLKQ